MSLFKLLPIAAVGAAGVMGVQALKKTSATIESFGTAATLNVEMAGIASAVANDYTESQQLPLDNFPDFLRRNMREAKGGDKRDKARDPWGTEYRLAATEKGFEVRSAGPDAQWSTADDLVVPYDLTGIDKLPVNHAKSGATTTRQADARQTPSSSGQQETARPAKDETDRKVLEFQKQRAAHGSPTSQYDLSLRYLEGNGVDKDESQARMWMQKAAEGGHMRAKQHLDLLGWGKAGAGSK